MCIWHAVSAVSGTTRDAVDTEVVDSEGNKFNLIDTAGIRKRSAVTDSADGAEPLSVQRAIQAVRRAQVISWSSPEACEQIIFEESCGVTLVGSIGMLWGLVASVCLLSLALQRFAQNGSLGSM